MNMKRDRTRRDVLKSSLALAGLGVIGVPEWVLPALAATETLEAFTDIPDTVRWETPPDRRLLDVRTIDGPFTPTDKFATTQHYGHPTIDPAAFRLKISGLVDRPTALSLDDLKKLGSDGPRRRLRVLGQPRPAAGPVRQRALDRACRSRTCSRRAGVKAAAREFVFFGADHGEEEVEWRTQKFKVDQQFGRSLNREKALSPEPLLA